mgnify:CR=1 FL=1
MIGRKKNPPNTKTPPRKFQFWLRSGVFCVEVVVCKSFLKLTVGISALLLHSWALSWNPFASAEEFAEVTFTPAELAQIQVQAGWAKGDDQTLIFELVNGLKGPIQCGAANVDLNDGKSVGKQFVPKFAIPGNATRNASMNVVKGSLKAYALSCSCFKKKGSDICVNPLKSS